jgi:hypothetical protein
LNPSVILVSIVSIVFRISINFCCSSDITFFCGFPRDGGTLSNELLQVEYSKRQYINITYITPYEGYIYDDTPITSLKEVIRKTIMIVTANFNNPLSTINQNCRTPVGEINKYFVKPGQSWGLLNTKLQNLWIELHCDNYYCTPHALEGKGAHILTFFNFSKAV